MDTIRTTIILPVELYERLKAAAYHQKKTLSDLVREGIGRVVSFEQLKEGAGIRSLIGKYSLKGKKGQFRRKDYYDQFVKKEMSFGH